MKALEAIKSARGMSLAELQKRLQARAVLAVSLETNEIAVALMRHEDGDVRTGETFSLQIGAEAALAEPERAGGLLLEELERHKIRERRCVVCLPRKWAMSATAEAPDITGEDLQAYLELRAEREFSVPVSDLRLAQSIYTLPDGKRNSTLAAVPAKRLEALRTLLETAGCRAASVSLGLDRSARLGATETSLQFLANCDHVDLVIAAGGGVTALRTLPGPTEKGFDAPAFLREVRITLGRLPEAMRREITSARISGTPESVETLVRMTGEPLQRLGIPEVKVEPIGVVSHPAMDAASQFLRNQPVLFELAPRQTSQWQARLARYDDKQRRWLLMGGLGLILLPILLFMIRARIESSLTEEWNGMRAEVAELEVLQQRIRQFRPWFETAPQTLQCMETLVECFPESGDVWAKSVQVTESGKVTFTGFSKNTQSILALTERLRAKPNVTGLQTQQMRGDSPIQFTIVYQWEGKSHAS